jgi:hypothetical protein
MIKIKIDNREEDLSKIDYLWINQQINRRREDGLSPSVMVTIDEQNINIILTTPNFANRYGTSNRRPNGREQQIFDLWNEFDLNRSDFSITNLIAFIRQLSRTI